MEYPRGEVPAEYYRKGKVSMRGFDEQYECLISVKHESDYLLCPEFPKHEADRVIQLCRDEFLDIWTFVQSDRTYNWFTSENDLIETYEPGLIDGVEYWCIGEGWDWVECEK